MQQLTELGLLDLYYEVRAVGQPFGVNFELPDGSKKTRQLQQEVDDAVYKKLCDIDPHPAFKVVFSSPLKKGGVVVQVDEGGKAKFFA